MNKEKNTDLQLKGIKAARIYLRRRGMEILNEEPFECEAGSIEIIAKDEDRGGLVFVKVVARTSSDNSSASEKVDEEMRDRLERIAVAFLESYDETDITVSFDEITITVISTDKAFVRHHLNIMGVNN